MHRWDVDAVGRIAGAQQVPSPNRDDRPVGEEITLVVIHFISLPPGRFGGDEILELFTNTLDCSRENFSDMAGVRVSAHLLIRRNGSVVQCVSCDQRAWHAGLSRWQGRDRCNDFSIGIEVEGCLDQPFEDVQYQHLNEILIALRRRYPIKAVVGHEHVAPGRKNDPGPCFDWIRVT